jgi:hypothetical protein
MSPAYLHETELVTLAVLGEEPLPVDLALLRAVHLQGLAWAQMHELAALHHVLLYAAAECMRWAGGGAHGFVRIPLPGSAGTPLRPLP